MICYENCVMRDHTCHLSTWLFHTQQWYPLPTPKRKEIIKQPFILLSNLHFSLANNSRIFSFWKWGVSWYLQRWQWINYRWNYKGRGWNLTVSTYSSDNLRNCQLWNIQKSVRQKLKIAQKKAENKSDIAPANNHA